MFKSMLGRAAGRALAIFVAMIIGAGTCAAQENSAKPAMNAEQQAAMMQELEAMRKRIDALEAEVKQMKGREIQSAIQKESAASESVARSANAESKEASGPAGDGVAEAAQVPASAESSSKRISASAETQEKHATEPFAFADFSWLNGNPREKETPLDTKLFTPEFRADVSYIYDFNHPKDDTLVGSSESGRTQEIQLHQLGIGGDFHYNNVRGRVMTQLGMYSTMTPRNDASPARGQWDLSNAYRYLSEAYGGYHFDVMHGVNVDAGIFMSYIGLFSYYNYDNWAYQPSYVSSNTPWYFSGVRVQIFPTAHLKIEPWFINGWQSYASANHSPGIGGQIKWTPKPWLNIISNNYGVGRDDLFIPGRRRIHTDNSVEVKYYDKPERGRDKMAFSLTGDLGCEYG